MRADHPRHRLAGHEPGTRPWSCGRCIVHRARALHVRLYAPRP